LILKENQFLSAKKLALRLDFIELVPTITSVLKDQLGMIFVKVNFKWIPDSLTDEQKMTRVNRVKMASEMLEILKPMSHIFTHAAL
jgi:hypothetical protein